jgi:hypothetical protein
MYQLIDVTNNENLLINSIKELHSNTKYLMHIIEERFSLTEGMSRLLGNYIR